MPFLHAYYAKLANILEVKKNRPLKVSIVDPGDEERLRHTSVTSRDDFDVRVERDLILVLDEAARITTADEDPNDSGSSIRCFLQQVNKTEMVALLLSTSSVVACVVPGHEDSRALSRQDRPPIFHIDFPDIFTGSLFERKRPMWH
jgi:hypothetical protein